MRKKLLLIIMFVLLIIGATFFYLKGTNQALKKQSNYHEKINDFEDENLADTSTPKLIIPYYHSNHHIVADYVLTASSSDMTFAIQHALNQCANNGGGTVWLERGIYNVSSPIIIPSSCTLMGDYQDPDNYQGTLEYGTKIVVNVKSFKSDTSNIEQTGLFKLQSSSGIEGLTIYYKNQNLNNPVEQPWSVYYLAGMLYSVKNVTLINSYRGIGRSTQEKPAHEMLMIENVKGTILKKGVVIHNSADVGTITGLSFKPKYWANANLSAFGDNIGNNSENSISNKIKSIGGFGIEITDAEQSQYVNITLSGFKYGIYIPDASVIKTRYMGSGAFYNLNISNCSTGIMVEKGVYDGKTLIDYRWGYSISHSTIEGSDYAIYTASSAVNGERGTIKLNNVSLKGQVGGDGAVIYNHSGSAYTQVPKNSNQTGKINNSGKFSNLNLYRKLENDGSNFAYLSAGSSVDTINSTLSSISAKGGGVVYLKPGVYQINKPIIIPANVELRGSSSSSSRLFNCGTTFNVKSNTRVISINGSNAGVFGINIIYEENIKILNSSKNVKSFDYSIVSEGTKNIYIKNVSISGATHGIYLNKVNNFSIENIVTGILNNAIRIDNSSDGLIMNSLQNGTVVSRNSLYSFTDETKLSDYFFALTKANLRYIYLDHDSNIEIQNCFTYGAYNFVTVLSSSFYAVNSGYDGASGVLYENTNSTGQVINALRMAGTTLKGNGGSVGAYNNAVIFGNISENDIANNVTKITKKYIPATLRVDSSISFNNLSKKEISYYYDGDGKISCKSANEAYVKCSISDKKVIITPVKNTNGPVAITVSASSGVHYSSCASSISIIINTSPGGTKGDVNGDGKISSADYILVKKHLLNSSSLTSTQKNQADVNGDGKINSSDYIAIKKIIIGGAVNQPKSCPTYYTASGDTCYDTTEPTINAWTITSLKNTTITSASATTTICNLGHDNGDGLKTIEYYTDCAGTKTASISDNCATINIGKCANSKLYYRLKDNYNYSSLNTVNDIGKYLLLGQIYNKFLYINSAASNNESNLSFHVSSCTKMSTCIKEIGKIAINQTKGSSNADYVKYLYSGILGRNADTSGLNQWVNILNSGTTRLQVLDSFIASAEANSIYTSWGYN